MSDDAAAAYLRFARRWERRAKHNRRALLATRDEIDALADQLDDLTTGPRRPSRRTLRRILSRLDRISDRITEGDELMNHDPSRQARRR